MTDSDLLKITIDGVEYEVPKGRTIMEALDGLGPDGGHEGLPISARGRGIQVRWE